MTKHTDSALNEAISSSIDGEHNDIDLQRVLSALDDNDAREQVSQSMRRYQMIGSVMRGEETSIISVDISGSVMAAIEAEAVPVSKGGSGKAGGGSKFAPLWYGAGKTAVAASVMLAVVMGVQTFTAGNGNGSISEVGVPAVAVDAKPAANDPVGDSVPSGFELPPLTARTVSTSPFDSRASLPRSPVRPKVAPVIIDDEYQAELNQLLIKHAENASSVGGMGALPYTRLPEASTQLNSTGDGVNQEMP